MGVTLSEKESSESFNKDVVQSAAEREPEIERIFEEFFINIFGQDELRRSKELELEEIRAETKAKIDAASGGGPASTIKGTVNAIQEGKEKEAKIQREIDALPPAGTSLLEQRLQEDADAKKAADVALGATAFGSGITRTNELRDQVDQLLAANKGFGEETRGISDQFIGDVGQQRGIFNTNIDQLLNTLRPTATRDPINLKFGNFETPFTSGTMRDAQQQFGDRNKERLGTNVDLAGLVKQTGLDQSTLENLLTKEGIGAERGFTDEKFDMKNVVANLINQIANQNLPNAAQTNLLKFLTGQQALNEPLRFGIPTVSTTGGSSTDSSSTGINIPIPGLG